MTNEYDIRLNVNRSKVVDTGYTFSRGDKGIVFNITVDEIDTMNTTAKIVFRRCGGSSVEADITTTNGVYSYTTLGNEFAIQGKVVADVKFYEGETKRVSTCKFSFDVTADTLDGLGTGTSAYSDTLQRLTSEFESNVDNSTAVLTEINEALDEVTEILSEVSPLNVEMQTSEATRQTNEETRQANETIRQSAIVECIEATENAIDAASAYEEATSSVEEAVTACDDAATRASNAAQACEDIVVGAIPVATTNTLGGIKSGGDITVGSDGTATISNAYTKINLATGTSCEWSEWVTPINKSNFIKHFYSAHLPIEKSIGDKYTKSIEIEFDGISTSNSNGFLFQAQGTVDSEWITNAVTYGLCRLTQAPDNGIYTFTNTTTITAANVNHVLFDFDIRCDNVSSGRFRIRKFKVEKGSIATDWTPAPEDIDTTINGKLDKASVANNLSTTVEGFALDALQGNPNIPGSLGSKVKAVEDKLNNAFYTGGNTKIVVTIPNYANGGIYGITLHGSGRNGATLICQIGTHNGQIVCTSLGSITATATLDATAGTVTISLSTNYVGGVIDFIGSGVRISPNITYTT